MNDLAAFPVPVVAAIHGDCLGGGIGIGMHGTDCIRQSQDKKMALPEVMLGLSVSMLEVPTTTKVDRVG